MKHTPKVLIVEDDTHKHLLYREVFEKAGFEVVICQDADSPFLEEVCTLNPDIISMDLMIGRDGESVVRDGFAAIEALKTDPRTADIPVIVLTSFFQEEKVRRAKELGAVDFITVQGQTMQNIPSYFLQYLKKPKRYRPQHPIFQELDT